MKLVRTNTISDMIPGALYVAWDQGLVTLICPYCRNKVMIQPEAMIMFNDRITTYPKIRCPRLPNFVYSIIDNEIVPG